MTRTVLALVALALMALPGPATAQQPQTNAPPGNSAIDEYLETIPAASGDRRPRPPAAGTGSGSALTPGQRARLERLGPDGEQLAAVVDATSPKREPERAIAPPVAEGRSPLSGALEAATGADSDAGGMGVLLPLLLLGTLLGVIALVVVRRRSAS